MPSERRLHPLSIFFGLRAQVRQVALPALAFLVTAGSSGLGWQIWLLIPIGFSVLFSIARYFTFRYRYDVDHIVISDGLFFRNERHIPYARIQNIDAVQTVLHRLSGVAEIRIETGAGQKPEATLEVLPIEALTEMRARVFGSATAAPATAAAAVDGQPLLALDARELVLFGLIHNRGMIVVGAMFGVLWELGVMDRVNDAIAGPNASGRATVRSLVRSVVSGERWTIDQLALALLAIAGFLLVVRAFSIGWALIRLYGFTLTRSGNDLRMSFGLLTHVTATIPLHRIQTVSIRENVLHRYFNRVTVRVETAGGTAAGESTAAQREWLAPLIRRDEVPALLAHVLPGIELARMEWQPPGARAFRREMLRWIVIAAAASALAARPLGPSAIVLFPAIAGWGMIAARKYIAHLRWAANEGAVALRSGWLSRTTSVVRFAKIQVVALRETPFDRRHAMASVRVDTAGATGSSHRVRIRYMARDTARRLQAQLAGEAERTAFEW